MEKHALFFLYGSVLIGIIFSLVGYSYAQDFSPKSSFSTDQEVFIFVQTIVEDSNGILVTYLTSDKFTDINDDTINTLLDSEVSENDPIMTISGKKFQVINRKLSIDYDRDNVIASTMLGYTPEETTYIAAIFASLNEINLTGATGKQEEFSSDEFWLGFTSFSYQLRFDGIVLLFILPVIVGLFIASRNGFKEAESIMVMIGGILLTAPLLTGFTELTNLPYRFVPLIVFFAIGVGVLLSKKES